MLKLILVLAAGYGLLVVAVYLMQGRMLYLADVPGRALTIRGTHNDAFLRDDRAYTAGLEAFLTGLLEPKLLR